MGSRGIASTNQPTHKPPTKSSLSTPFVRGFRRILNEAMSHTDDFSGKKLSSCIGAYAFLDYDGDPIYVGQTIENFGTRIGRHLTGQRSDTVAYRILDPFEVAEIKMWPLESARSLGADDRTAAINSLEYSVYMHALSISRYGAILNEKLPPASSFTELPDSYTFDLIPPRYREDREHPDVRIARRAENLSRLAAVAHERGEVSAGLRRVIVIQAIRLADLAASRLSDAEGRPRHDPAAIDVQALIGDVHHEPIKGNNDFSWTPIETGRSTSAN